MKQECLNKSQTGSILPITLIILLFMTIIGIATARITTTEITVSGYQARSETAFYNAESGIQWVLAANPSIAGLIPNITINDNNNKIIIDRNSDNVEDTNAPCRLHLRRMTNNGNLTQIEIETIANPGQTGGGSRSIIAGVQLGTAGQLGAPVGPGAINSWTN